MAVIDMCVAAEHLAVDVTDVAWKCGWETRSFAEPGVLVVASGWLQGRSVCAECVGWETCWVGDFAGDPALDICYVLVCWDTDSLLVLVEPSVCDAGASCHGWACLYITQCLTCGAILLLNNLEHAIEEAVLFDNLMGEPFSFLHQDRLSSQSHEIAFDDQVGVLLTKKEGLAVWIDAFHCTLGVVRDGW